MDKSAVEKIAELAVQASTNNIFQPTAKGEKPAIFHNGQLVSLESLQEGRSRFRGHFSTPYLSEFVSYVDAHKGGHGFIDSKACCANVFFNLGDNTNPGHADWTASLDLVETAAFAALRMVDGQQFDQKALVEWIEDWAACIRAPMEGQPDAVTDVGIALQAIRNLTITSLKESTHVDRDLGAKRSVLEDVEATSKASKIPPYLVYSAIPYQGFAPRDFRLRLSVLTGEKPRLVLRIVGREAIEEEIAQEFKTILLREIGDAATMVIGSFNP